jgi:hypothetical protein
VENKRSVNFHRFGLDDAGDPIESSVGDLCKHVGFTDVAAPRGCWRLFEQKKSLDSRLAPSLNLYLREKRAKTYLLCLIFNYLSFALGFESMNKNRKQGRHSDLSTTLRLYSSERVNEN